MLAIWVNAWHPVGLANCPPVSSILMLSPVLISPRLIEATRWGVLRLMATFMLGPLLRHGLQHMMAAYVATGLWLTVNWIVELPLLLMLNGLQLPMFMTGRWCLLGDAVGIRAVRFRVWGRVAIGLLDWPVVLVRFTSIVFLVSTFIIVAISIWAWWWLKIGERGGRYNRVVLPCTLEVMLVVSAHLLC